MTDKFKVGDLVEFVLLRSGHVAEVTRTRSGFGYTVEIIKADYVHHIGKSLTVYEHHLRELDVIEQILMRLDK